MLAPHASLVANSGMAARFNSCRSSSMSLRAKLHLTALLLLLAQAAPGQRRDEATPQIIAEVAPRSAPTPPSRRRIHGRPASLCRNHRSNARRAPVGARRVVVAMKKTLEVARRLARRLDAAARSLARGLQSPGHDVRGACPSRHCRPCRAPITPRSSTRSSSSAAPTLSVKSLSPLACIAGYGQHRREARESLTL